MTDGEKGRKEMEKHGKNLRICGISEASASIIMMLGSAFCCSSSSHFKPDSSTDSRIDLFI